MTTEASAAFNEPYVFMAWQKMERGWGGDSDGFSFHQSRAHAALYMAGERLAQGDATVYSEPTREQPTDKEVYWSVERNTPLGRMIRIHLQDQMDVRLHDDQVPPRLLDKLCAHTLFQHAIVMDLSEAEHARLVDQVTANKAVAATVKAGEPPRPAV